MGVGGTASMAGGKCVVFWRRSEHDLYMECGVGGAWLVLRGEIPNLAEHYTHNDILLLK